MPYYKYVLKLVWFRPIQGNLWHCFVLLTTFTMYIVKSLIYPWNTQMSRNFRLAALDLLARVSYHIPVFFPRWCSEYPTRLAGQEIFPFISRESKAACNLLHLSIIVWKAFLTYNFSTINEQFNPTIPIHLSHYYNGISRNVTHNGFIRQSFSSSAVARISLCILFWSLIL